MTTKKWSINLQDYSKKCKENIDTVRKKVAFQLYSSIVKKTPIDTGRARGNWHISVGQESGAVLDREVEQKRTETKHGNTGKFAVIKQKAMIDEALKQIEGSGDKPIYIQNNLPYIVALEYGHSKQAPNGMVGVTVANVKNYVDKAVKEVQEESK